MDRSAPTQHFPAASAATRSDLSCVLAELRSLRSHIDRGLADLSQRLVKRTKSHLTVEEVAELTGRAAYTIRRWIKEGRLTARRLQSGGPRGRLLIAREELDNLVLRGDGGRVPDAALA